MTGAGVEPPQRHLNGHTPLTAGSPHGIFWQITLSSGTGVVEQLKFWQKSPENPGPHWQEQVATLNTKPLEHVRVGHCVTVVVITGNVTITVVKVVNGMIAVVVPYWKKKLTSQYYIYNM